MTNYIGGPENNRWTLTTADGDSSADGGDGRDTLTIRLFDQTNFTHANWNGVTGQSMASTLITFINIETLNFHFSDYAGTFAHTGPNVAHVYGGAGGDAITVQIGDTVDGGGGRDSVSFNFAAAAGALSFVNDGGAGIEYTALINGHAAGSVTDVEILSISGSAYDDRIGGGYSVYPGTISASLKGNGGTDTAVLDFSSVDHVETDNFGSITGYDFSALNWTRITLTDIETVDFSGGTGDDDVRLVFPISDSTLRGGAGNDTLSGGSGHNVLIGGTGDDILRGVGVDDTASYIDATGAVAVALYLSGSSQFTGDAGSDTLINIENLIGSAFDDALSGDGGDNAIDGGGGGDTINGGLGIDTASYASAPSGVTVSLAVSGAQNTGGAGTDFIYNVENLLGSSFADTLTAATFISSGLSGGAGDDTLIGAFGDDTLDGGAGIDTAGYGTVSSGVTVSLAITGAQNTIGAGIDTLIGVENLSGSALADHLSGNGKANQLSGSGGNDVLAGSGGEDVLEGGDGADRLSGGNGVDTASYAGQSGAVLIALRDDGARTIGHGAGAEGDMLISIENLTGGTGADRLTGNNLANILSGGAGNDMLIGGEGDDILIGAAGKDTLTGGLGADEFEFQNDPTGTTANNADTITDFNHAEHDHIDLSAIDAIAGTPANDSFRFIGGAHFFGAAGELRVGATAQGDTVIQADTDGDKHADVIIRLTGSVALSAADFVGVTAALLSACDHPALFQSDPSFHPARMDFLV